MEYVGLKKRYGMYWDLQPALNIWREGDFFVVEYWENLNNPIYKMIDKNNIKEEILEKHGNICIIGNKERCDEFLEEVT